MEAVQALRELFEDKGAMRYGEAVNQTEHALQGAAAAEAEGATAALVLATLLHDVGHMLHRDAGTAYVQGIDDRHEVIGARWLARWFGPEASEPVRLHVAAKRYLCHAEPGYLEALTPVSRRTLELQGGPMSADEAARFIALPHAPEAARLRRYDEAAKVAGAATPDLEHFLSRVGQCPTHPGAPR